MAETKWTPAQLEAINAEGENLLVSAAAGSGKTAVLVERVIRRITQEDNPLDISRLLVMTFTRAAAAQMKSKIFKALREQLSRQPENAYLRQQLMKVQSARICTIDSLCAEIVRDHIQDVDLDPGYRLADEAEMNLLRRDTLQKVLEESYAKASEDFLELVQYYADKNDNKLEEILLTLYRYAESHPEPQAWIRGAALPYQKARDLFAGADENPYPYGMKDWMREYADLITAQIEDIRQMAEEGLFLSTCNYGPYAYEELFRDLLDFTEDLEGRPFDYRVEAVKDLLDHWKNAPRISTKNGEVDEKLKEAAADLRKEIRKRYEELQEQYLYADLETIYREMASCAPIAETITELTLEFSRQLAAAKKEKKVADFSDIAHYALQILLKYREDGTLERDSEGEPLYTPAADRMALEIEEVIVDEYQDTNMLQEYLVKALSRERFGRPNVFMVGDVKQSIYGFRMACPELFLEKMQNYRKEPGTADGSSAGRLIILDRNFRSRKEVLDLTNRVFSRSMIREAGGIAYQEDGHALSYGGVYGEDHDSVCTPELAFFGGSAEQAKYLEAYHIARRIETLLEEGRFCLNDIVILTRSTDNPQLEEVLYQRGIPIIKNSGKGFWDSLEIRLVVDLLKIIDNPYQDIALAAVLYSPLCNASAQDLARIRLAGRETDSLFACLRAYRESDRFTWLLEKLESWRQKATYMGIYDFLEMLLQDSGLYTILIAMPQGNDRRANLDFLKSKAAAFARGSYTGLFHFIRYIRELQDNEIDFGTANALSGAQAVRMMTIHKSKGLEFPVVFLACCGKKYNASDYNASIIPDRELGLGLERRDPAARMVKKTALMQTIRNLQKNRTYAEEMRLLYVAMTRAKEKLIITGTDWQLSSRLKGWEREALLSASQISFFTGYRIMNAGSYLQLLGLTLHSAKDNTDLFRMEYFEEAEGEEERAEELLELTGTREILEEIAHTQKDIFRIRQQCEYRYPYEKAARMQGKITASQLERRDEEYRQKQQNGSPAKDVLQGAERGNAYHRFFELLDYGKNPEEQLEELIRKGLLTQEYAAVIDMAKIHNFLDSEVGQRMGKAFRSGRLFRERQFVMGTWLDIHAEETLTGPSVHSDVPDEELLLVQGIIDAYFIEENEAGEQQIVLVDYKTDRVSDEEHYRLQYTPQLEAYADALERGIGLKVAQKIIYSLELGRGIFI